MPEDPIEEVIPRLDAGFDALERGDLDEFDQLISEHIHPDCEFRSGIGSVVGGGAYKGHAEIRGWFADLLATTSDRRWRNRRYEEFGDSVLVFLADFSFTGVASGAPVSSENGAVFEWENGLCVRMTSFMSHAEALQAAEAIHA
jgi:ketosteroid isomerase-like protein